MSDAPVILIGAGGHARVLLDALSLSGAAILGLVDKDPALIGQKVLGYEVLGGDEEVRKRAPGTIRLVNAIGSDKAMDRRRSVYETWRKAGYSFASVQHPGAIVSRHAMTAAGVQIMAGAVVQACASIGENTIVNTGATVDHDCNIGAHVHLAPGVTLSGNVHVGDGTHVGTGAKVIQGRRIGARCTIAAGAVVVRDVADGTTAKGIPAREVRT